MKVFLSSTAQDLDAYRKVADDTILRLSQQTVAMERFGPLPGAPVEECERLAREGDVVVCIVAHRYGFVPQNGKGSITQREIEAAKAAGKDVLVWIVADNYPWIEKQEQDLLTDPAVLADPARVADVAENVAALITFKKWLSTTFTPETFTTPDDLGKKIAVTLSNYISEHKPPPLPRETKPPLPQDRVSIARLPVSGADLFGRDDELQLLDKAWEDPSTNIITFIAWGGVGKTALVNHWLKQTMARDNYRGAERVYAWSFYSQGTSERAASADLFIDQALRWFGDTDPTAGSPWDKGERLARYIRQTRTLLILDGLEPIQHPPGSQEGRLKDAALQALLVELAAQQPGLCVISTRERVGDLVEFENGTVVQHDLEQLSPEAGAQILRSLNVKGDDEELEEAAKELGGHAFSLTLLGSYLDEVLNGDIRRREEIENLFDDTRHGDNAQKMIAAYETWLGEGMELAILRLLGLFDRPADGRSIDALRAAPAIPRLTEPLFHWEKRARWFGLSSEVSPTPISEHEWQQAVAKLRRIKLLGAASRVDNANEPDTLDAHPLVREHFKQQLKRDRPDAWRESNNRLYEHFKKTAKEFPDTIEEMSPLYAAVAHGCAAGRHEEALNEVYIWRIQRADRSFNTKQLGAIGAELAVLSGFFERPWEAPVVRLRDQAKAFVLNEAGYDLRAMGRLQEAAQPTLAALNTNTSIENTNGAAVAASNLSQIYLTIGELPRALELAKQSVELADRSDNKFQWMTKRVTLADALNQVGRTDEAEEVFRTAEQIQTERQPAYPLLYSLQGFQYCDLLLAQGKLQEVKERGRKMFEWRLPSDSLLDIALDNLSIGRASLLEAQHADTHYTAEATEFLQRAVDGLRGAGEVSHLPRSLLVRADLYRFNGDYERAERDLAEVHRIATRSGMGLHLADYHLESARLRLAQDDKDKAREHLTTAKEMIERMGYHRRDKEVKELEQQLG
jgi:tetratricopeptide (TPR) repeat protein